MSSGDKPFDVPGTEGQGDQPTGGDQEKEAPAPRAANRFDIRRLIGGLFCLYALILIALGIFGSHTTKNKAAGVNVDLWTGLGMLVFGLLMIGWALWRPVVPIGEENRDEGPGELRPAT